mgnify:CR=1 FL=1
MQIKVYHKKAIQNGFFSKSIVEVKISGYNLSNDVVTSVCKLLKSFESITECSISNRRLIFTVEASAMYDTEHETQPFDKQIGHDIAENKAVIKAYKTAIKVLRHLEKIRAREMNNLEDVISNKLFKQLKIRSEIIGD